ncbi:MAG: arsenosugar biosynthesis radical SAM protein ArsS [Gammaproteobacteria bacterium]|nr:arsenosugar biosynthesis radical SAM protein ArsS [Gammaproteobacteria bacterium]MBL6819606.1 arsenosugar biosynthesis radical SAM protein ArsS [Gammaproteobacteria bacterium]
MHKIYPLIKDTDFPQITRLSLKTLQVNLGYKCNQSCLHCHVNASPKRTEMMNKHTIDEVISFSYQNNVGTVDLTGGAPEMNQYFEYMIKKLREKNIHIIDRCNLTILEEKGMSRMIDFLAEHEVEIVASLPCYKDINVDAQRGKGVFTKSIKALQRLNKKGYGMNKKLMLNLVYNPQGAELPPKQTELELEYKSYLLENYNILFNNLFTITNMPINRFGSTLISKKMFHSYMDLLKSTFSQIAKENVMCRNLLSIDYEGYVYDCDFNQMLGVDISNKKTHITDIKKDELVNKIIATGDHCYGCTAGSGSSCGGVIS